MKLTDSQLVVLNRAANHEIGMVDVALLADKAPIVRHNILTSLLKKDLIVEVDGAPGTQEYYRKTEAGTTRIFVITEAGKAALGIEDETPAAPAPRAKAAKAARAKKAKPQAPAPVEAPAAPTIREGTKQAQLIALLKRPKGVTVDEVSAEFGWQKHTTRAAISHGIGKKLGFAIASEKEDRGRVYRITA